MSETENIALRIKKLRELIEYHSNAYYNMDAPEIDGKITFTTDNEYENGDFVQVKVIGVNDYDLIGRDVGCV